MNNLEQKCVIPSTNRKIGPNALALRRDSEAILKRTQYWAPPVPPWKPLKKSLNSSLRVACIVEGRLFQGLRFEGEVILLTPDNWKYVLRYGKPDFLLMESIWTTATGHWHMGQCPAATDHDELVKILILARTLSIPTVFWFTKGYEYHENYKKFARYLIMYFALTIVRLNVCGSRALRPKFCCHACSLPYITRFGYMSIMTRSA
jgi:hypothetical protein